MKVHHVSFRFPNIFIKVEVLTTTGREDQMVVDTAIKTLRREGIYSQSIVDPVVEVVYNGPPTTDFPCL